MHRCNAHSALTYTPEDVFLFKDSPFASWMERLSVDNPDHGIEPDWDHGGSFHKSVKACPGGISDFDGETGHVASVTWNDFIHNQTPAEPLACARRFDSETLCQSESGDVVVLARVRAKVAQWT